MRIELYRYTRILLVYTSNCLTTNILKIESIMLKLQVTPIQFLKYFINLPNCLFVFKFYLSYDDVLGRNQYKPRLFSMGLIFIWVGVICRSLVDISEMYELISTPSSIFSPLLYFTKARQFTAIIYEILISVFLHQGVNRLTEILNLIENDLQRKYLGQRNILSNPFVSLLWMYAMVYSFLNPVIGVMEDFCTTDKCENPFHSLNVYEKTLNLFFIEFSGAPFRYHTLVSVNTIGVILKAIDFISSSAIEAFVMLLTFILYFYASLITHVISETNIISEVLEYYDFLKKMTTSINKCMGTVILGSTLVSLPYFIDKFLPLIDPSTSWLEFSMILVYFFNLFLILYLAVSIRSMASAFEEWISDPLVYCKIPDQQLVVLVTEIHQDKIGLVAGGFGMSIKITNSFFGTMIITWLTFALLILQFKLSNPSS